MSKLALIILAAVAIVNPYRLCAAEDEHSAKVIAYYFHGSFRCYACNVMEKYIHDIVKTDFKDAISKGSLEFKSVNVEKKGNEHFIRDYQLYTKSLVLSLVKDNQQIEWKNLTKIWQYARNKDMFFNYVKEELNSCLKEIDK